jgi:hypothetical protein
MQRVSFKEFGPGYRDSSGATIAGAMLLGAEAAKGRWNDIHNIWAYIPEAFNGRIIATVFAYDSSYAATGIFTGPVEKGSWVKLKMEPDPHSTSPPSANKTLMDIGVRVNALSDSIGPPRLLLATVRSEEPAAGLSQELRTEVSVFVHSTAEQAWMIVRDGSGGRAQRKYCARRPESSATEFNFRCSMTLQEVAAGLLDSEKCASDKVAPATGKALTRAVSIGVRETNGIIAFECARVVFPE